MGGSDDGIKNFWGKPNDRPYKVTGSCVDRTVNAILCGSAAGTLVGAVQLAWNPDPIILPERGTRLGATARAIATAHASELGRSEFRAVSRALSTPIMWFAGAGAAFASTECLAEAARGTSDPWNAVVGGLFGGAVCGSMTRRFDIMTSAALGTALLMGLNEFHGPDTVYRSHYPEAAHKTHGLLPKQHAESEDLTALKEKYPKWKNI